MIANHYQRTFSIIQSNIGGFLHYKDIIQKKYILNQNNNMLNYSKCTLRTVGYHYILSIYHCFTHTYSLTISRTWMDFKMADTSELRVFWVTILLKYHDLYTRYCLDNFYKQIYFECKFILCILPTLSKLIQAV